MEPLLAMAIGLEVQRFARSDDTADALSGSLDALQSGAWTLSPYTGPAIQPYFQVQMKQLSIGIAPSGSWRQSPATAADGREGSLRVNQWRLESRLHWHMGRALVGLDGGFSSGRAEINGESVAEATQVIHIAPTAGIAMSLAEELFAVGRVLWPIQILDAGTVHGPTAALAIEWRP